MANNIRSGNFVCFEKRQQIHSNNWNLITKPKIRTKVAKKEEKETKREERASPQVSK